MKEAEALAVQHLQYIIKRTRAQNLIQFDNVQSSLEFQCDANRDVVEEEHVEDAATVDESGLR